MHVLCPLSFLLNAESLAKLNIATKSQQGKFNHTTSIIVRSSEWNEANYLLRHLYTRVAAHGLHRQICAAKGFHSPNEGCQCTLCGGLCSMYHIIDCKRRTLTLSYYADDTNFNDMLFVHNVFNKSSTRMVIVTQNLEWKKKKIKNVIYIL